MIADTLILEHVERAHPFHVYGVERAQMDVHELPAHALGELLPPLRGRLGSHVHHARLFRVCQARHQEAFVPGWDEFKARIAPYVVHAERRIGQDEAAMFHTTDSGSHHVRSRKCGIERHVRFLGMLPQPRHLEWVAHVLLIFVKDHDHRAEFQAAPVLGLDVQPMFMEAPQGFADIRALAEVRNERLRVCQP